MGEMRFDRSMSDAEGLMWRLEKDPHLSSTFGTVAILDRAPDFDSLRRRMEHAAGTVPRLRQRVQVAPGNIWPPVWVDDADFSIDRHVRRIACPHPGTLDQALELAALIVADPFDRARPLWQFIVIEGLGDGKAALLAKMHHTISDGERGIELSMQYIDLERDAPEPPPAEAVDNASGGETDDDVEANPDASTVRELLMGGIRIPLGVAQQVRDLLADPAALPDASSAAAKTLHGIVSQLFDTGAARSPLWNKRSLDRRLAVTRAPLPPTKEAANKLGGTINTALLTAAADAAATYHQKFGAPVESLRASMAISTRTETSGSNAFSLARLLVPADEMPIDERFRAINEATQAAREASESVRLLATLTSALPTSLLCRLARQQSQTVDFATSNVRGAPMPVYIAGAQMLEIYPIGPLGGVAFNLTLMSYSGSLDMGVHLDRAAVDEPELLIDCLDDAFDRLAKV